MPDSTIEYLPPEIQNEGQSADAPWVPSPRPHVWDYAPLKEHPHYGQFFAAKPFKEWPAIIYNHKTGEEKRVENAREAAKYGVSYNRNARFHHYACTGDWMDEPQRGLKANITTTGKSLVSASSAQAANSTADSMAQILQRMVDKETDKDYQEFLAFKRAKAKSASVEPVTLEIKPELPSVDERALLIEAAASRDIKIDKRWGLDKIKEVLDEAGDKAA